MQNTNHVVLSGTIAHELTLKTNKKDESKKSCLFQLAVNRGDVTNFINCVALNDVAINLVKFCTKKSKVVVQGELQSIRRGNMLLTSVKVKTIEYIKTKDDVSPQDF